MKNLDSAALYLLQFEMDLILRGNSHGMQDFDHSSVKSSISFNSFPEIAKQFVAINAYFQMDFNKIIDV